MKSRIGLTTDRRSRAGRAATAVMTVGVGLALLTGCSADPEGPEAGAVTVEDLQGLEDRVAALEERVGVLEDGDAPGADGDDPGVDGLDGLDGAHGAADDTDPVFDDTESYVGRQVAVSAEVSELVTTTDVGGAFRIAGESGEPIAVVSATPPPLLGPSDVVRVSGTVMEVRQDSFEADFGVAAGQLFDDPDAWFEQAEGQIAISADRIELLEEQSDG